MARIIGGIGTSHVPAIGNAIAKGLQNDPYWKPFFDGFPPVREWIDREKPDVAVVIYNDHGLNFFLDKMPTFAVGAAEEYQNEDEGWGLTPQPPFKGIPELSWHIIESLVEDEFDITTCQEMKVDHAFVVPMQLIFGNDAGKRIKTVPVCINTVQHPIPSPSRCFALGRSLGHAIESYPQDLKVVVIGTGGLSHQLDGKRAGFINKKFDLMCLEKLVNDPKTLSRYSAKELIRQAGSQGAEFVMWLAMRGAMTGDVNKLHSNYHIPISNTAAGLIALQNAA
jgi:protocatechuate 4,5-dioxygenase, beta chain